MSGRPGADEDGTGPLRGDRGPSGDGSVLVLSGGRAAATPLVEEAAGSLTGRGVRRVILLTSSGRVRRDGWTVLSRGPDSAGVPLDAAVVRSLLAEAPGGPEPWTEHGPPGPGWEDVSRLLRRVAPEVRLVPIALHDGSSRGWCREVARRLAPLLEQGTAVVAVAEIRCDSPAGAWPRPRDARSALVERARETVGRALDGDLEGLRQQLRVSGDRAPGLAPMSILAELVDAGFDGGPAIVDAAVGMPGRGFQQPTVAELAAVRSGGWRPWRRRRSGGGEAFRELSDDEGSALVELARDTLRCRLGRDSSVAGWFRRHRDTGAALRAPAGAFVTLHNTGERAVTQGRLRACMGTLEASEPAVDAVIQAALSAGRDPRFPALELAELDGLDVEVSVLSPLRRVAGADAIEVGRHGVVLSQDHRRAVFLPQVAPEQGWDRDTMLWHLARKAGLPGDAWRDGATFEVFTAQVFADDRPVVSLR